MLVESGNIYKEEKPQRHREHKEKCDRRANPCPPTVI